MSRGRLRYGLMTLAVALVGFVVLGAAGAVLWRQLVTLPEFTRTAQGAEMDQMQLAGMFGIDGWFAMIGLALGLIGALALMVWRHRVPVWTVVCGLAGSALASGVMAWLGERLGPAGPQTLRHAAVGARAPVRLVLDTDPVRWSWALGVALGLLVVLMFTGPRGEATGRDEARTPVEQPSAGDRVG